MLRKIAIYVLFLTSVVSFSLAIYKNASEKNEIDLYNELYINATNITIEAENSTESSQPPVVKNKSVAKKQNDNTPCINHSWLKSKNKDYLGWIQIKGTPINYPFVQDNGDNFYLHKDFYKKKSSCGTIFRDYSTKDSDIILLFGHNMGKKKTTMFSSLKNYKDRTYFNEHSTIVLSDEKGEENYSIFGVVNCKQQEVATSFLTYADVSEVISKVKSKSINFNDKAISGNKILILCTCDRSYDKKDGRLLIFATKKE